jgi:hypothetical protein
MATLSTDKSEALERMILEELTDDYLGMWEVAQLVRDELGTEDDTELREHTLSVLETMLMHGLIRPGLATSDGRFDAWELDPGRAALRISDEWERLGRMPTLGDIAWLDLTDYGEKVARS